MEKLSCQYSVRWKWYSWIYINLREKKLAKKDLSLCDKLKFSKAYIFPTFDNSNLDYLILQN